MLTLAEARRVALLVKQGLGPTEIQRAMKFKSLNRAVRAIARVRKYPDLEWALVSGNRRKLLCPDDPTRRPTVEELSAFLERMLAPDAPRYGGGFTRWVLRLAKANGLGALAKKVVRQNARVRNSVWTPEKAETLRAPRAARRGESSGGGDAVPRGRSAEGASP